MSGLSITRHRIRKLAHSLVRLTCCFLATLAVIFPSYSSATSPLLYTPSSMAESEGMPGEETESTDAESTGSEHLLRCDGRRHLSRPAAILGSLSPLLGVAPRPRAFSCHECPATEHALRDGLGAPLRI
jgi:hypothetical protein